MQRDPTQTAVYKIFYWKYQCKIPEMVVYPDAVLEEFGTFVSGNEGRDVSNATMLVGAVRTIAELCEIHAKGFKIELPDNKKMFEIYSLICEHLKDCVEYQKNGMFGKMPPMEDLVKLDKFAAYIFPQARHHFVGEVDDSSKLMNFLSRSRTGRKTETKEKTAPTAHVPITPKFDNRALTGTRRWK